MSNDMRNKLHTVVFNDFEFERCSTISNDKYKFEPKGRFKRLQCWAFNLLRHIGALTYAMDVTNSYKSHIIDPEEFINRFFKQRRVLVDLEKEPHVLLMGSEDFAELMYCPDARGHEFGFAAYFNSSAKSSFYNERLAVKVVVLPYLKGSILLPEIHLGSYIS